MISASGFYQLNYSRQADLLEKEGLFLFTRTEGKFVIDLYEVDDLLIEIYYQKETEEPVSIMAGYTAEKLKTMQAGNLQPRLTIRDNHHNYQNGRHAA